MKTKLITLSLLMSVLTQGAVLVNYTTSDYITSSVTYNNGVYQYEYTVDSKLNNRDISHITIDICESANVFETYANDVYVLEWNHTSIKFDSITPTNNTFVFGFFSNNAPTVNFVEIKSAGEVVVDEVLSPSCQIPEPSMLPLVALGAFFLFKRRP